MMKSGVQMSPYPKNTFLEQTKIPERIIKRDLREMDFDAERLQRTLSTIRRQHKEFSREKQTKLQAQIIRHLIHKQGAAPWPSVLQLQDAIERSLWVDGYFKSAKQYINDRAQSRFQRQQLQRLRLFIQAMRQEIKESPKKITSLTADQANQNWQSLCLSLFEQILNHSLKQTIDNLSDSFELSEGLKTSLSQLPADVLDCLLGKVEERAV